MLELLLQSLEIKEKEFGADHQELCLDLANLGTASAALNRNARAQIYCDRGFKALDLPEAPFSSRRHGVVLLKAASVYMALERHKVSFGALGLQLLARARSTLEVALGGTASARVLALESVCMGRIWAAANRSDVGKRLSEQLLASPRVASDVV